MTEDNLLIWVDYSKKLASNLTDSEYVLLSWIAGHPNAKTSDIVDGLRWNYGNVANTLSRMVDDGWLDRPSRGHYRVAGT